MEIKFLICDPKYPNLFYDRDMDQWIDATSGRIFNYRPIVDIPVERVDPIEVSSKGDAFVSPSEFFEILLLLACEGNFATLNKTWLEIQANPDLIIGQTKPFTEKGFEQIKAKDGITFRIHPTSASHPIFTGQSYCKQRDTNCVEIEHSIGRLRTEESAMKNAVRSLQGKNVPDEQVSFNGENPEVPENPAAFETLLLVTHLLKSSPNDKAWNLVPTLLDFLFHKINLVNDQGETGIPNLLSWVAQREQMEKELRTAKDTIKHLRHIVKTSKSKRFGR